MEAYPMIAKRETNIPGSRNVWRRRMVNAHTRYVKNNNIVREKSMFISEESVYGHDMIVLVSDEIYALYKKDFVNSIQNQVFACNSAV